METEKTTRLGTLYGVGVGPGDPELITLKAINVLNKVERVFAASSSDNEYSIAFNIVSKHLKNRDGIENLKFPMTRDPSALERAWHENARRVLQELRQGKDVGFITLGDPLTYSTFCHLMRKARELEPGLRVVSIPGITSYHAAAARVNTSIAQGTRGFYVVSGLNGGLDIKEALNNADTVFVLKAHKRFKQIKTILEDLGLEDKAILVKKLGLNGEEVIKSLSDIDAHSSLPYLSLVIIQNPE